MNDGLTERIQDGRPLPQGPDDNARQRHRSIVVGVVLSVMIHIAALWLLIAHPPVPPKLLPPGSGNSVTVYLTPAPSTPPPPPRLPPAARAAPPPKAAPRAPRPAQPRRPRAPVTPPSAIVREAPRQIQPEPATPSAPPADDMFTQLEAARRRRAEAQGQDRPATPDASSQPSEAPDPNSIARANVAESLKRATGPNQRDSGGVFQVRQVGFRDATFVFHGWSAASRRQANQLIEVELGREPDIQTAVVKKMIEIIRAQTTDTFVWDSHRLGKQLTLSARREDSAELEQFLMREFFPEHIKASRR